MAFGEWRGGGGGNQTLDPRIALSQNLRKSEFFIEVGRRGGGLCSRHNLFAPLFLDFLDPPLYSQKLTLKENFGYTVPNVGTSEADFHVLKYESTSFSKLI